MKANELRIGNLVKSIVNLGGSLAEKCRFDKDIFQVNKDFIFHDLAEKCQGIPLTSEWLLKFGFAKISSLGFKKEYLLNRQVMIYRTTEGDFYFNWGNEDTEIMFVHELQNLFFALTGQELTIKESAAA